MLLSIETSALNAAAKLPNGLSLFGQILDAEGLRPAIGTHTIYELAKLLWNERHEELRCRLYQLIIDLDPAFLVPADRLIQLELRRLQRGEPVIPFLMGSDLEVTKRVVARLASGESDEEAIAFTKKREHAIEHTRGEEEAYLKKLQEVRRQKELPRFRTVDELIDHYRPDIPDLIRRRFNGRIDLDDARRFADRLDDFPGLRTAVRADFDLMLIRIAQGQVPGRDRTADYRHVVDASYCSGILVQDKGLLRRIPILNPQLRAVSWPAGNDAQGKSALDSTIRVKTGKTDRLRTRDGDARLTKKRFARAEVSPTFECIYCGSTVPPTKREHVMSQLLGTFEQNWTLDCVCDECNGYFANQLELALGRDSREALLRLELGLKSAKGASELLHGRVRASLQDPGRFDGIRMFMRPSSDGTQVEPVPVPQVGFRVGGEDWVFLVERELSVDNLRRFQGGSPVEIRIYGIRHDCERLRQTLAECGIEFQETDRVLDQPITEQSSMSVLYQINNDETIVRAACKIGFNRVIQTERHKHDR